MEATQQSREWMEKSQLFTCNIRDEEVLAATQTVDRSEFVPEALAGAAYVDEEIPLCSKRFLMEPLAFAQLLELADIKSTDRVLDIGCGFGYSSAVIAELAGHVIGIENQPELVSLARKKLTKISNIEIITSPLVNGSAPHQPFDVIVIEGAVQFIPDTLINQLNINGRLVTVENQMMRPGSLSGLGRTLRITKYEDGQIDRYYGKDVSVPVMPGFEYKKTFQF